MAIEARDEIEDRSMFVPGAGWRAAIRTRRHASELRL